MTKIVSKSLPHAIANSDIVDGVVRNKVMLLQENITSLYSQLSESQKALVELQGGSAKVDSSSIATKVAPLVESIVVSESATAAASASAASASATTASTASGNAVSAKDIAVSAKDAAITAKVSAEQALSSAIAAKETAESARDAAQSAARTTSWHAEMSIVGVALSNNASDTSLSTGKIPLSCIVDDITSKYEVTACFVMCIKLTSGTRYFVFNEHSESVAASTESPIGKGDVVKSFTDEMTGSDVMTIVNGGTSSTAGYAGCSVFVKIVKKVNN